MGLRADTPINIVTKVLVMWLSSAFSSEPIISPSFSGTQDSAIHVHPWLLSLPSAAQTEFFLHPGSHRWAIGGWDGRNKQEQVGQSECCIGCFLLLGEVASVGVVAYLVFPQVSGPQSPILSLVSNIKHPFACFTLSSDVLCSVCGSS